jgi:hypothetical protein
MMMVRAAASKADASVDNDVAAKVIHRTVETLCTHSGVYCQPSFPFYKLATSSSQHRYMFWSQAKALDSVLKEVNQRFGKGSIMKLGGTSQIV